MKNKDKKIITGSILLGALLITGTAFAQAPGAGANGRAHTPGVFGTVSAVNGNTLTISSKGVGFGKDQNKTPTTYTVDATNATVTKDKSASSVGNIAVGDTVSVRGTISGTNVTATSINDGVMSRENGINKPGVFGTVSAVNGNTITINSKIGTGGTATTYTIDATSATVTKAGVSSSVANIAVGDTLMVQGTVSGTNVTATSIRDNVAKGTNSQNLTFKGNGQPVVGGNVTAINGSTITITNKSSVTYTIDATNATVVKNNATSSISNVTVGDNIVAQGTVNGNAVTAISIIDSGTNTNGSATNPTDNKPNQGGIGGFFKGIGGFFHNLFGFF